MLETSCRLSTGLSAYLDVSDAVFVTDAEENEMVQLFEFSLHVDSNSESGGVGGGSHCNALAICIDKNRSFILRKVLEKVIVVVNRVRVFPSC